MENIIEILSNAQKASQISLDTVGRVPYPTLGIVTNNNDPMQKRRIKVASHANPQLESDWIRRLTTQPIYDAPLPRVGQTVLILYIDGIETNAYYLSLHNDTNPALTKDNAQNDLYSEVEGTKVENIKGDDSLAVEGKQTTNAGDIAITSELDIQADVKGNVLMNALQAITLQASQYVMFKAGNWFFKLFSTGQSQMGGGILTIDMGGFGIHFTNCSSMSINGKQIATTSAVDSRGDTIVQRGW